MEIRKTTCNRDCPDACGVLATVEEGRVVHLKGDPDHPVTKGFLCYRTSRFVDRQYAPDRVKTPLLRLNGELRPVSMEQALDVAAERLLTIRAESGPEAVFHYRSGGSLGLLKSFSGRFFEGFGPVTTKLGDICSGAGEAAQLLDFGVCDSNDLFDLRNSRNVYVWGKNPFTSSIHLVPILKELRAAGGRITLIDPVAQRSRSLADRVVQPRPGADLDLALGVARVLHDSDRFDSKAAETCDNLAGFSDLLRQKTVAEYAADAQVEQSVLEEIADDFANGPTAILVGWGLQRRRQGGAIIRALDALSAVSGNLFCSGGGCSFYFARRASFVPLHTGAAARHVREPLFGPDVLAATDPPIRAIWVTAGNPVCMLPDSTQVARALDKTEFVVVVDPFLTDTGRRADLVLPVPTLLEDDDLLGSYGHHWLAESKPVVAPPPGVLHEVELFKELASRVGLTEHMAGSVREWKERLLGRLGGAGVTLESLGEQARRNPFSDEILFPNGKVKTPSGRVNLITDRGDPPAVDRRFPFWLFSNSTPKSQGAQWAGPGLGEHTWVAVHPSSAPDFVPGETVMVVSAMGSVRAELKFDEEQRTDIAIMPKGGHFDRGQSANALIEAEATDIGLGAAYLDCRVALRRIDADGDRRE